ncbi:MAG: glycosyltransferase family 2 protein, partial [Pseudomonadota bacterium]
VPERLAFAVADSRAIQRELTRLHGPDLAGRARTRCPEQASCRADSQTRFRHIVLAALVLFGAAALAWPQAALTALLIWIVVANFATTLLRGSALATGAWRDPTPRPSTPGVTALADHRQLPMISLLVPLLREDRVLHRLIEALRALDYPRDCLEVKLLLEADDTVTRASLTRVALPPWIDVITVPEDSLRTKPRAMNYALDFCQGGIIGIYDAEDRPDPDQLRKVARRLSEAPRDLACVQARLDFYNPRQNWLTRCFAMEYAVWFAVLLPGMTRLRMPIPLGGTSVFFRRDALDQVGAWDAHNVTEDADLGMRLARHGYRCEMIDSTTHEEANCRMRNWIMQRSRWLKGYAITWMTHMQDPRQLFTDLGPRGFATFQVLFLGAMTSYLALPLFWTLVMLGLFGIRVTDTLDLSGPHWTLFWISMPVGQLVMITAIAIAVRTPAKRALVPWILTLPVYWPLGALAAYRALAELFAKPFHWHKTEHGLAPDTGSD